MNKFSENLNALLKEEKVSQVKLSKYLGISQQTVSKYVSCQAEPGLDTVIKIAKFFDVSTDFLLGVAE